MNSRNSAVFSENLEWVRVLPIQAEISRRATERARAEEAAKGEVSLYGFVKAAWHVLEPSEPFVDGWHIAAICRHLEAVTDGRIARLAVNVPPGSSKSLIVSVFWPAWEWGPKNMPYLRYLTTSYSEKYVKRDARRMRDLVSSEWYRSLWGRRVQLVREAEMSFGNTATGFREGVPVGSLTAGRGDRVIIDDPHSTETAESEAERETTKRIFRESVPLRLNNPKTSAIIVIMQRLHEEDVCGIIDRLNLPYERLVIPMEFEVDRRCQTSIGWRDPRTSDGELMCPERFPREVVERDKIVMGSYAVAGQFQQRPSPRGGGMFKESWLQWYEAQPTRETLRIYAASDYAVTEGGNDYTVHGVFGVNPNDDLYVLDWWRRQAEPGTWIEELLRLARQWRPTMWAEESGQIEKSIGPFIRKRQAETKNYFYRRQYVSSRDKPTRAQAIRARIQMGKVYFPRDAEHYPWVTDLVYELTRFPAGAHDDQVDVLSLLGRMLASLDRGEAPPETEKPQSLAPDPMTIQQLIQRRPKRGGRIY